MPQIARRMPQPATLQPANGVVTRQDCDFLARERCIEFRTPLRESEWASRGYDAECQKCLRRRFVGDDEHGPRNHHTTKPIEHALHLSKPLAPPVSLPSFCGLLPPLEILATCFNDAKPLSACSIPVGKRPSLSFWQFRDWHGVTSKPGVS
jgi:hypothetical protein